MRTFQRSCSRVGPWLPACALAALMVWVTAPVTLAQSPSDDAALRLARRHAEVLAARASLRSVATRGVTVVGVACTEDQQPVANPRLRLRSVEVGVIVAETIGGSDGGFIFERVPGGSYIVELVGEDEAVQAVGAMLTAAPGDVVATLITAAKQRLFVPAVFSQTSTTVVSTAASAGMTGLTEVGRPATREQ